MSSLGSNYALLDSGSLGRLERFGSKTIVRPSTVAVWKRRLGERQWKEADAEYIPDVGWKCRGEQFESWRVGLAGLTIELTLQSNGQIGIFPEHANYLPAIESHLEQVTPLGDRIEILNLFGYTGLATAAAARFLTERLPERPFQITHVDISKRALEWLRGNLELSGLGGAPVRTFPDDAVGFISREARRERRYDLIIADPPSFSRVSKRETWNLDEQVVDLAEGCLSLLSPRGGKLFFTNHSSQATSDMVINIARDFFTGASIEAVVTPLTVLENGSERRLPLGSLAEILVNP